MKSVSIIGATLYGNRGAEAMLAVVVNELKRAFDDNIHFNVYSYYPKNDNEQLVDKNVRIFSGTPAALVFWLIPLSILIRILKLLSLQKVICLLPKSLVALYESSCMICIAGVSFIDGRTKVLPYNVATLLPAIILGIPVVKLAQAIGPFANLLNRVAASFVLKRCNMIFARGDTTYHHLEKILGERANYRLANDLAFLLQSSFSLSKGAADFQIILQQITDLKNSKKPVVGLCPSSVVDKKSKAKGMDYHVMLSDIIIKTVNEGYKIVVYPNATRNKSSAKEHNNDLPLISRLENALSGHVRDSVLFCSSDLNATQIRSIVSLCDVNVVSRFHAMIGSLSASIPCLVIGWSHKYHEVMKMFDQEDMVFDYSNNDSALILNGLGKLIEGRKNRGQIIHSKLPQVCEGSMAQLGYLIDFLKTDCANPRTA